ncbi:lipoteichoic acid synthase [Bacilli bacterium PM5-3]|nr:lipoteichoic acid synthase [Bacilli bacterium PM5-3]MDH6604004.1 lipoteichoic acid synthase [Bacilli bacterium PM5-9]
MKLKKLFSYLNILYIFLGIFTFIKMICFTYVVYNEMSTSINGCEFVWESKYLLSYLFCAFSIFSIALIFNGRKSLKILVGLDIILSLFMFANLIYFRSFESYLSVYNIAQYRNFGIVGTSAFALLKWTDILLFIDPIFLIATYKFWVKIADKQQEMSLRQRIIAIIFPVICAGITLNYNDYFPTTITKLEAGAKYSIIGHHYYDLSSYIEDSRSLLLKKDVRDDIENWFEIKNKNQGEIKYEGKLKGKNVVFLQIESLENFVINLKVENQEITPTLNKLLKNSIYFDNIVAQENGGNSSDADFMANTSLIPLKSGSVSHRFPNNKYKSLPVILRSHNYSSHVIHSGEGYFWNKENFLPNLGFDVYTDIKGMNAKEDEMFFMGLKDKEHFSQVADYIKKIRGSFYLFTVTETSHTPFEVDEDMQYLNLSEEVNESVFGKYFQSIRYTDEAIKLFIEKLDKSGILDNTMIVIYGDHEGIHKYNNNSVLEKSDENYNKYDNNSEVPVLIYSKDIEKGEVVSKVGGQIDIMPTVLSLLGIDENEYINSAMGNNLLSSKKGYAIDRNGTIYGDYTDKENVNNIKKSINISELIIRSNYFSKEYLESTNFIFNGKLKKLD